jgi:hypothetical protein
MEPEEIKGIMEHLEEVTEKAIVQARKELHGVHHVDIRHLAVVLLTHSRQIEILQMQLTSALELMKKMTSQSKEDGSPRSVIYNPDGCCTCGGHGTKHFDDCPVSQPKKTEEYKCDRCGGPGNPPHSCPFQEEINDNFDKNYCTCCDECTHECAMDI